MGEQAKSPLLLAMVDAVCATGSLRDAYTQTLVRQGRGGVEHHPAWAVAKRVSDVAKTTLITLSDGHPWATMLAEQAASIAWLSMAGRLAAYSQVGWSHYAQPNRVERGLNTDLARALALLHFHKIWCAHIENDRFVADTLCTLWGWDDYTPTSYLQLKAQEANLLAQEGRAPLADWEGPRVTTAVQMALAQVDAWFDAWSDASGVSA